LPRSMFQVNHSSAQFKTSSAPAARCALLPTRLPRQPHSAVACRHVAVIDAERSHQPGPLLPCIVGLHKDDVGDDAVCMGRQGGRATSGPCSSTGPSQHAPQHSATPHSLHTQLSPESMHLGLQHLCCRNLPNIHLNDLTIEQANACVLHACTM
jgi:hypothetical protein